MTKNFNDFAVGETVKIVANNSAHGFEIGSIVTLTNGYPEGPYPHFQAAYEGGMVWYVKPDDMEKIEVTRPTIDFSSERYATARLYAERSNSTVLAPDHRAILNAVAAGEVVDAIDLDKALVQVLSLAATRAGQSSGRRQFTKMGRHLAYIAQSVIEAHVDRLPTYETGERSRLVETLKGERAALKGEVDRLALALADTATPLAEAREEVDSLTASLKRTVDEANEYEAALQYALSLLEPERAAMVRGFADGFRKGATS